MADHGVRARRLRPTDRAALIRYLEQDRLNNLFPLANLAQVGMEYPELRYFGAYVGDELLGALMLMRHNAGVAWHDPSVLPEFARLLLRERALALSGRRERVEPLLDLLPSGRVRRNVPARCAGVTEQSLRPWPGCGERLAGAGDIEALIELYSADILLTHVSREEHRQRLERTLNAGGLIVLVERDGLVVSGARTSAVGHGMAMIGSVATLPAYRRRGFARACTGLLSRLLIDQGIEPYLTYDFTDPAASRTYASLGFVDRSDWLLTFFKPA